MEDWRDERRQGIYLCEQCMVEWNKQSRKGQSYERVLSIYANEIHPVHSLAVGVYPIHKESGD